MKAETSKERDVFQNGPEPRTSNLCGRGVQNPSKGGNGVEGKTSPEVKKLNLFRAHLVAPGKVKNKHLAWEG